MNISIKEASQLSEQVLAKYGYSRAEAETIAKSLIWSQKRNNLSQGLNKLFGWRVEKRPDASAPTAEIQNSNVLLVNANLSNHILALDYALKQLDAQKEHPPVFLIGVKNTENSAGALGYFTEKLALQGNIAIMLSAADPGVVPYGGSTAIFGTNPISIAVPTSQNPVLLDMSTASLTWGDLVKAKVEGIKLPEGYAFDTNGLPTTDPEAAMDGSVTTFDQSYKSSGLALIVQILAGPLVGSIFSPDSNSCQYGSLVIVIKSNTFGNQAILQQIDTLLANVKAVKPAPGFGEITLPGELGYRSAANAEQANQVEISEELYQKLKQFLE